MSPSKPVTRVQSVNSQGANRWPATVYDQHKSARFPRGRPWWGYLEYPSDPKQDPAFVCELQPGDVDDPHGSSWDAPWLPNQITSNLTTFFRVDTKKFTLTWLYSAIIADDKAATTRYWEAAFKIAHQNGWKLPDTNQPPSFQIRSLLLEPPRSPKIAEAALAGDPWILGHTSQENEELSALLRGTVVQHEAPLTPEQVLSEDPAVKALVDQKVAEALEAMEARLMAKLDKQSGKKPKADAVAA